MQHSRKIDIIEAFLQYTDCTEPSKQYRMWTAISTIASMLQKKCWLEWNDRYEANMYVVLCGPSGSRKTTAMSEQRKLLDILSVPRASDRVTNESFIREFANIARDGVTFHNGVAVPHCSMTVIASEWVVFLGHKNVRFIADLTDLWDYKDVWKYTTKHQGSDEIVGPFLNIIGGATPENIYEYLPAITIGSGFTARVMFVYAPRKGKLVLNPFHDDKDIELYEYIKTELGQVLQMEGRFRFDKGFVRSWAEFYTGSESHHFFNMRYLQYYADRRPAHALKLCMIISASRSNDMIITSKDLAKAVEILDMTEKAMPRIFMGIGQSNTAGVTQIVLRYIKAKSPVSFSQVLQQFINDADKDTLDGIIESLQAMRYVSVSIDPDDFSNKILTCTVEDED